MGKWKSKHYKKAKACKSCGSKDFKLGIVSDSQNKYYIKCNVCMYFTAAKKKKKDAIKDWNGIFTPFEVFFPNDSCYIIKDDNTFDAKVLEITRNIDNGVFEIKLRIDKQGN